MIMTDRIDIKEWLKTDQGFTEEEARALVSELGISTLDSDEGVRKCLEKHGEYFKEGSKEVKVLVDNEVANKILLDKSRAEDKVRKSMYEKRIAEAEQEDDADRKQELVREAGEWLNREEEIDEWEERQRERVERIVEETEEHQPPEQTEGPQVPVSSEDAEKAARKIFDAISEMDPEKDKERIAGLMLMLDNIRKNLPQDAQKRLRNYAADKYSKG